MSKSFKHGKDNLTDCDKKLKALTKVFKKEPEEVNIIDTFAGSMFCDSMYTDPKDANKVFIVTEAKRLICYDVSKKTQRIVFDALNSIASFHMFKNGDLIVNDNFVGTHYLTPTEGNGLYNKKSTIAAG